ncbi:hypothetical protein CRG98_017186 [Punica granatum]|uniref:Uncharacterized protein n=1 Tax=Punica granatum TaxID=22663 RepID=A0A2I0K2L8_PUNGR|nr:hypothetical protein CRG98_017186 [Punica granatum]
MTVGLSKSYNEKSKGEGVGVANQRPRTLHRGCRHPQRMLATSVERSGLPIGGTDPLPLRFFVMGLK